VLINEASKTIKESMKNMTLKPVCLASTVVLGVALFSFTAPAQDINWGSPQALTGDANLLTTGVYFDAFIPEYTGTALSVGGINFNDDTAITTSGGSDGIISYDWDTVGNNGNLRYSFPGTFSLGSTEFNAVMEAGGAYVDGVGSGSVTIGGLTAGDTYSVQEFEYDNANGGATILGGSTPATITGGSVSGQGEFVTGTFTATGPTETSSLTGDTGTAFTVLGSLSVRDVTAVPEPSTAGVFAGGLVLVMGLIYLRRREMVS
jgi:hypothetical protein